MRRAAVCRSADTSKTGSLLQFTPMMERFRSRWLQYARQRFCSKSCSNITVHRRVKKISTCVHSGCRNVVSHYTLQFCKKCISQRRHLMSKWGGRTLEELTIAEYCKRLGANRFDSIRGRARQSIRDSQQEMSCSECGWQHHVEVCHIKPISSFDPSTLISDVNDLSNLKLLCPNCHWLFDHQKESGAPAWS